MKRTDNNGRASIKSKKTVAIVGGGFSGSMFAIHLLRMAPDADVSVVVFDRSESRNRGVAYSTENHMHLLNVPASQMSAFPEEPDHFVGWLKRKLPNSDRATYASRVLYGDYLEELFRAAQHEHGSKLAYEHGEVVEVMPNTNGKFDLILGDGRRVEADLVVLAIGNYPPANPSFVTEHILLSGRYISDPWKKGALDKIGQEESVLVLGTGLTMIDKVVELRQKGHHGPITAISRRGLMPQPNAQVPHEVPLKLDIESPVRVRPFAKLLRSALEERKRQDPTADWRGIVDALRPHTQEIWQAMPFREKKRFLNHVRPFWEIVRHRVAPPVQVVVDKMVESGQLRTLAASIVRIVPKDQGAWVWTMLGTSGHTQPIDTDWIVNCSGSGPDFLKRSDPLTLELFRNGFAVSSEIGLGLMATKKGEVVDRYGRVQRNLLTIGPPLKGLLWESTAVMELRVQAEDLARHAASVLGLLKKAPAR